jgi:hypothetical protein
MSWNSLVSPGTIAPSESNTTYLPSSLIEGYAA